MKLHPFNIKYVEETTGENIILHEDITSSNFIDEKKHFHVVLGERFLQSRSIFSLLHTFVNNKDIYHGDIYLDRTSKNVYIYTLYKKNYANDILGHGFFLLKQHRDRNKIQFIFDKNEFIFVEDFINGNIVYLGNIFVHLEINKQVKDKMNYELGTDKNYSLNDLKGGYKRYKNDFYFSTYFNIYFFDKKNIDNKNVSFFSYAPIKLTKKLAQINEKNDWEIGIDKEYVMYNKTFDNAYNDSFPMITGIHYKSALKPKDLNIMLSEIKNYSNLMDKFDFVENYKNFFAFYDGRSLIMKTIDINNNPVEFLFDEQPIPYNIKDLFYLNSNKNSESYKYELLKVL